MQPFDKHPADVGALRQCGSDLLNSSVEAINNGEATRSAYAPAIGNWQGMCAPELAAAAQPVQDSATSTQYALAWAAAVTQYWGVQVEAFNTQVDAITANLASQATNDYGATGTAGEPPTDDQIADARAGVTHAARQQWHQAHATYIEDGRSQAAAMLRDGPTEAHLLTLHDSGVLAGHGFNPWPGMVSALQGLVTPSSYLGSLGFAALVGNISLLGVVGFTSWTSYIRFGAFKPRGPDGRFISPRIAPWYMRFQERHWVATPYNSAPRNRWLTAAKWGNRAAGALAIGTSTLDQWSRDSGRNDLETDERVGRAATRGLVAGGAAWGGALAGAKVGAVLGSFGGPAGTVIGGVAGAVVGGVVGAGIGNEIADHVVDFGGDVGDVVGDGVDAFGDFAGDVGSALNPFDWGGNDDGAPTWLTS